MNENSSNSLLIFTDASKLGYRFAVYNVADGCSNLLYAKSLVAPVKVKTLPTLELLGVHHALKSLPIVLDSFAKLNSLTLPLPWILKSFSKGSLLVVSVLEVYLPATE